ncbi:UNVERIFIED_CONTAM: hypothetical protein GTU68_055808 [Idotea baltica]|nr:hypothetical protein [Idotea baltica]
MPKLFFLVSKEVKGINMKILPS